MILMLGVNMIYFHLVVSENFHTPLSEGGLEIPGGGGVSEQLKLAKGSSGLYFSQICKVPKLMPLDLNFTTITSLFLHSLQL